jgi:hypothetical protein
MVGLSIERLTALAEHVHDDDGDLVRSGFLG